MDLLFRYSLIGVFVVALTDVLTEQAHFGQIVALALVGQ